MCIFWIIYQSPNALETTTILAEKEIVVWATEKEKKVSTQTT